MTAGSLLVDVFDRGVAFEWIVTFDDVDSNPINPQAVTLFLSYLDASGDRVREDFDMEQDTDGAYVADWDSSVSKKCRVYWCIRAYDPPAADEGFFQLAANRANLDPDVPAVSSGSANIAPAQGNLVLSAIAPTLALSGGSIVLSPASANLVLSGAAPSLAANNSFTLTPAAGGLAFSAVAPSAVVGDSFALTPPAANLALSAVDPDVDIAGINNLVPSRANLAFSGTAPAVSRTASVFLSPASRDIALSATAPTVRIGLNLSPVRADLVLAGTAPTATRTASISLSPARANIALSSAAPTVASGEDTDQQIIQTFLGQPISLISETTAQGGVYADWDALVTDYLDAQHTNFGSGDDTAFTGAVYDRPLINYVEYVRSGDSKYLTRGHSGVVGYRGALGTENTESYGAGEPYRQFTSMALHYLLTGDEATRTHLGNAGDNAAGLIGAGLATENSGTSNSARIMAHALVALISSAYINAPSDGDGKTSGFSGGNDFEAVMHDYVDTIIGTMSADGGHRFEIDTFYTYSYQIGLLDDALIHYYLIYADSTRKAAILAAIKKRHEFMWTVMLDQYDEEYGFIYIEGPNTTGGESQFTDYQPPGRADLACWLCGPCGFLYHVTGDPTYRTRALQLMANSLQGDHANTPPGAYLSILSNDSSGSVQGVQHKIFSELTRTTWRFMSWALETPLATPVVPVNTVLPAITGTASSGSVLTCSTGTWSNSPSSFNYAWCKRPTAGGVNTVMQSSSTSTYTLQAGDVGFRVFCLVTATNGSGAGIIARAIETATVT